MAFDANTLGVQFRTVLQSIWNVANAEANVFYRIIDDTTRQDVAFYLGKQLLSNQDNIDALSTKVNTLIGSDSNKSVRKIAAEELAAQLIPSDAQESLDTLEEIAQWIQDHPDSASAMNQQIQTNKEDIAKIVDGTTTVEKAKYAETAGSANTATTAGSATTAATASNAEKLGGQLPSYYATASALSTGLAGKANASDVYKKTETYTQSEVNDLLDDKADAATTLAGYGITDAYTETEVNNLLNNKADKSTTYSKTDVDGLLADKANSADVYTQAQADAKFIETVTGKSGTNNGTIKLTVDGVDSADIAVKGLGTAAYQASGAFATAAQGAKADTAVQEVVTGETNGTIKVDGAEVKVAGLGTAAYQNTGAFDAAGAATTAKNEVIGVSGDATTANTIYGAKAYAYDVAISGAASALNTANTNIATALSWIELSSM